VGGGGGGGGGTPPSILKTDTHTYVSTLTEHRGLFTFSCLAPL